MKTLEVSLGQRSYPIHIGDQALGLVSTLACVREASSVVLVSNHTVQALYGVSVIQALQTISKQLVSVVLPDGEAYKTSAQLDQIHSAMLTARCDRKCVIIALGGGVVGDVAGFAAATYMRGVAFVQVPTTLLAQVDSSVGGKTAINHPLGKNMIGAFYQPQAVLADTQVLRSLPPREVAAGLAEVIKYGCMADAAFFTWLEQNIQQLNQLDTQAIACAVQKSCALKAQVVSQDETESSALNIRALLNFGHTFGHAFESVLGYGVWLHGEAVGYGMICAAAVSQALGLITHADQARIKALVAAARLPISWPNSVSADAAIAAMMIDKKNEHGQIKFIVLSALGASHVQVIEESLLRKVIAQLQS